MIVCGVVSREYPSGAVTSVTIYVSVASPVKWICPFLSVVYLPFALPTTVPSSVVILNTAP